MNYRYPLIWPVGVARTKYPHQSRFDTPEERVKRSLELQLDLMKASSVVVTTNVELRRDGRPYVGQRVTDAGVAVYFTRKGQDTCVACDRWDTIRDNLQAVAKTLEALRGIERWGTAEMVEAAYRGFTALPAEASAGATPLPARSWWEVLEVSPSAGKDVIEAAYKAKRRSTHPDAEGGSEAAFLEVERAYEEALS